MQMYSNGDPLETLMGSIKWLKEEIEMILKAFRITLAYIEYFIKSSPDHEGEQFY